MSETGALILVRVIDVISGFDTYHLLYCYARENSLCNQWGKHVCSSCFASLLVQNSKRCQEQNYFFYFGTCFFLPVINTF